MTGEQVEIGVHPGEHGSRLAELREVGSRGRKQIRPPYHQGIERVRRQTEPESSHLREFPDRIPEGVVELHDAGHPDVREGRGDDGGRGRELGKLGDLRRFPHRDEVTLLRIRADDLVRRVIRPPGREYLRRRHGWLLDELGGVADLVAQIRSLVTHLDLVGLTEVGEEHVPQLPLLVHLDRVGRPVADEAEGDEHLGSAPLLARIVPTLSIDQKLLIHGVLRTLGVSVGKAPPM